MILLILLIILIISSNLCKDDSQSIHMELRSYKIWLPIGTLINLPCDPFLNPDDQNKSKEIVQISSAAEWYDLSGFYLHTGFLLPIRPLSQEFMHGLICNILDRTGEIIRNVEHRVSIHYQPTILWSYKIKLTKSQILSGNILKKPIENLFRNISKLCNSICEEMEFCEYQFIYFHKSPYEEFLMSNEGSPDPGIEEQMNKLLGDAQFVTFYFKVSFTNFTELLIDPYTTDYKSYIVTKQKTFFDYFTFEVIDVYLQDYILFSDSDQYVYKIELICPPGSEEVEGYIVCQKCAAGYYAKPGGKCQPCEYGTFQGNEGSSECVKCPDIYKTIERASTKEEECIFDGPFLTAAFYYYSGRIWDNTIVSHRTFAFFFIFISCIYVVIAILIIGWFSYRIHLYRKIIRRKHLAFEQLLTVCTVGNINLNLRDL